MAWHEGGDTSTDNLGPGCKRDHLVKSSGAFRVRHLGQGTFEWIAPSGHRYRRETTGRITHLPRSAAASGSPDRGSGTGGIGFPVQPPF